MTAFKLEFFKSKRRHFWLIVCAMLAVELLWIFWSFRNPTADSRKWGWMELLYNIPLLNQIFFPIISAVLASRMSELEHNSHSFRLLRPIQYAGSMFTAKFLCGSLYLLCSSVANVLLLVAMGNYYQFDGPCPVVPYLLLFVSIFFPSLELFAFQLSLSLHVPNQMVSLCVGCGGSFVGLLLMFLPHLFLRRLLPWGHIASLMFVGLCDWDPKTRIVAFEYYPFDKTALLLTVIYLVVFFLIGRRSFIRKEV